MVRERGRDQLADAIALMVEYCARLDHLAAIEYLGRPNGSRSNYCSTSIWREYFTMNDRVTGPRPFSASVSL